MQIVIDVSEENYKKICNNNAKYNEDFPLYYAIKNGIPLPKGHGRLIDADEYKHNLKWNENIDNVPTIIEADKEDVK